MLDFNEVDLNLLRVFQALLEERSLTRAAHRVGLSQPSVSYSLGRLRALFDDPLLVRTPSGMKPTLRATQLMAPLELAVGSIRDVLRRGTSFDPATSNREFSLSMSDLGEQGFLPILCSRLQQCAPSVSLNTRHVPLAEIGNELRLGRIDFAIGNTPELKLHTQFADLFREPYVCMTRKRAGLPVGRISQEAFGSMLHISVASNENSHGDVEPHMQAAGLHRTIALCVPHFMALPSILRRTDWMATVPRRVAVQFNEHREFAVFDLPVQIPEVEVTVHWHEASNSDEGSRWLREVIIESLRDT